MPDTADIPFQMGYSGPQISSSTHTTINEIYIVSMCFKKYCLQNVQQRKVYSFNYSPTKVVTPTTQLCAHNIQFQLENC